MEKPFQCHLSTYIMRRRADINRLSILVGLIKLPAAKEAAAVARRTTLHCIGTAGINNKLNDCGASQRVRWLRAVQKSRQREQTGNTAQTGALCSRLAAPYLFTRALAAAHKLLLPGFSCARAHSNDSAAAFCILMQQRR